MPQETGRITKNTLYLTIAYIFQKVLAFVYFALLARFLGAGQVGKYVFALSFTTIFSIFIDLGLSSVLIREVAKAREKASQYLSNVIGLKIFFSIIAYALVFVVINLLNYPADTKTLVYLAGAVMILDSFTLSFYAVFRGFQRLKFEGFGTMIYQTIVICLGGLFLLLKLPLFAFVLVIVTASVFNFFFSSILLYRKESVQIRPALNKEIIKFLFKIALPFAIAGIFVKIYSYIDSILLSKLAGDEALGLYSVAYKLTFSLQFIPAAFGASIFPAFSHFYKFSQDKLKQTFEKAIKYLTIIALPLTIGTIALADKIITKIYGGEYVASILPLQILICTLIFIFLNYPIGSALNACDKQKINTRNIGIAMVVNVILNIILIPRYSFVGASIAALCSYGLLTLLGFIYVTKTISYDKIYLIKVFLKSLISAFVMGIIIYYFRGEIFFVILIIPAAVIYFALLYSMKALKKEDVRSVTGILRKK